MSGVLTVEELEQLPELPCWPVARIEVWQLASPQCQLLVPNYLT